MRHPNVAEDLVPIAEFKSHASEMLRRMHETRRPLVITQHGRAAAVVLTPEEYEALCYRLIDRAKVAAGQRSADERGTRSAEDVRARVKDRVRASRRTPRDAG
jgi:prevent-host-death family protein